MPLDAYAKDTGNGRTLRSRRPGYTRLTLEIPTGQHARFKALCAARGTTMHDVLSLHVRAQLEWPDSLLTESYYLQMSAELKREIEEYAFERHRSPRDLLLEAFARLVRDDETAASWHARRPRPSA